jgi:hypothetical protein
MSPTEEFRNAIQELLSEVQRLLRVKPVPYPLEYDEDWENEVVTSVWDQVVCTGLFSKTPASPEKVGIIAEHLRQLPLIKNIPLEPPPYDPEADHAACARDLGILEHKLREMLECMDASTTDATTPRAGSPQEEQATRQSRRHPPYSEHDRQLYEAIEPIRRDDVQTLSVAALWKQYRTTWNELRPRASHEAFRASIYRIRNYLKWLSPQR